MQRTSLVPLVSALCAAVAATLCFCGTLGFCGPLVVTIFVVKPLPGSATSVADPGPTLTKLIVDGAATVVMHGYPGGSPAGLTQVEAVDEDFAALAGELIATNEAVAATARRPAIPRRPTTSSRPCARRIR